MCHQTVEETSEVQQIVIDERRRDAHKIISSARSIQPALKEKFLVEKQYRFVIDSR